MSRSRPLRWISVCLVVLLLASACSGRGRLPRWRLPDRGPVDVFEDIIDQVSRIGDGIARQFRGFTGPRR
ncbi:MAG: hypothetical protein ACP5HG_14145 [Anaerolineae bacterium]